MKLLVSFVCMVCVAASSAHASNDVVAQAMKLVEKHHYDEAVALLEPKLASLDPTKQGMALLTLGNAYLRSAELHRELYQSSVMIGLRYFRRLAARTGGSRSRYVNLFRGELYLDIGKASAAASSLEKFVADQRVGERERAIARVMLGTSAYLRGEKQKAEGIWKDIVASDPEVRLELAAAYSRTGQQSRNPVSLCDAAVAEIKKRGKALSSRTVKNALAVYVKAGLTDKGFDVIRRADLKAPSYRERIHRSKEISFYSASLLNDLSSIYLLASRSMLERAARDAKVGATALFYLAEAYAVSGQVTRSSRKFDAFLANGAMPRPYRNRATIWQAANQYRKGKKKDARSVWDEVAKRHPVEPDLLGEVLLTCGRLRINCPGPEQAAVASLRTGKGKRYAFLSSALGKYFLERRRYAKALTFLEAGRDKGNKNKIEANDPLMLAGLADLYYRRKQFSEALEIYFEMSKHFPQVRQIQEPLQGIYSMEQKSAGDVKIH